MRCIFATDVWRQFPQGRRLHSRVHSITNLEAHFPMTLHLKSRTAGASLAERAAASLNSPQSATTSPLPAGTTALPHNLAIPSLGSVAPPGALRIDAFNSPLPSSNVASSPDKMMREEQLGKVRDNLLVRTCLSARCMLSRRVNTHTLSLPPAYALYYCLVSFTSLHSVHTYNVACRQVQPFCLMRTILWPYQRPSCSAAPLICSMTVLQAAELAIEKLRQQAAKAISVKLCRVCVCVYVRGSLCSHMLR